MGKKRSDIEILADILKVAESGARKSHIVYKANLNFKIVKGYLDTLTNSGLITGPEGKDNIFSTTKKGTKYLNQYKTIKEYIKS